MEGDEEVKINLDDKSGSLLDFLNAWQEKIIVRELNFWTFSPRTAQAARSSNVSARSQAPLTI